VHPGRIAFSFANLGGGIRSTANLVELGKICEWFQCDNQGRGGDDTPIWGCALQGRVCRAVQSGKMATTVTGAWSTGAVRWRNVHKSPEEARMWMNETLASGMVPYHHIVGGETGLGEDRRGLEPARQYFNGMAKHDPVTIQGDGVVETFAWGTDAGFVVHVLNCTNPAMHRGWLRAFYPIGPQEVRLALPASAGVARVELLRAEKDVPFRVRDGAVSFTIPSVADCEVAAIHSRSWRNWGTGELGESARGPSERPE
jgi:hypothetical protein